MVIEKGVELEDQQIVVSLNLGWSVEMVEKKDQV